jgi:two-component system sensor histidine kinase KdpD
MVPRPRPDERLHEPKRGRLTIFFGAAVGVGKTFAMLQEAGVLQDVENRDVVVGIVETHGRFETTTLLAGFERLPRRRVSSGSATVEELDLDAALARRPNLLLLDELAHTNAAGSRHRKRWQDVEELLDAGIDVYTTLNVQHVESLNDVVAQVTGVVVRETVPDAVIDAADEMKLIDLPPDELIERLKEGKVYLPAEAERAMENFFQKGNLIALRELALRKTAERVDADMLQWRKAHGVEKMWAASDRLLVCIGASPTSENLLRVGRRMAAALRANWFAVCVETPEMLKLGPAGRGRVSQNLRLAEQLGAETITLTGQRPAEAILRFARERNVTKIIVGKPRIMRFRDRLGKSIVDELLLASKEIDIYATVGEPEQGEPAPMSRALPAKHDARAYGAAALTVVLATCIAFALFGRRDPADVVMTYLLGIVLVSMRFGFRASILGAVLSVLAFDFFFIPPYLTFSVANFRHIITFAVMLLVAVVVAGLTQRVRDQAEVARRNESRTAVLYALSKDLSRTEGLAALLVVAARHLEQVFDSRVAILTATSGHDVRTGYVTDGFAAPVEKEDGVIRWVLSHRRQAGRGTATLAASLGFYAPLRASGTDTDALGVLGIYSETPDRFDDPEQRRLAEAFASQLAVALERARLADETERARVQIEAERLRSTLLSSVSHDLRTPLAVMKGAASTLVEDDEGLAAATRRELAVALLEETERLERLVRNLLDMTRLESGAVRIRKEWQSVEEVVGAALNRVEARLAGRKVAAVVDREIEAPFDAVLIEQVLVNLLENAIRYTPEGTPIDVDARREDREIVIEVADRGPGVGADEHERIFDKFQRGASERTKGGVGLGLTICRAILIAHGGRIGVVERVGGGASFRLALPLEGEPPAAPLPEILEGVESGT